jgi:hypothetical protein
MVLPQLLQFSEALATDLQIPRGRFPRLLRECVQDINSIRSRGDVEHAVCPTDVDSDIIIQVFVCAVPVLKGFGADRAS